MIRRTHAGWPLAIALGLLLAADAEAQILRDLPAVDLEYVILHGEAGAMVGSMQISFGPVETSRGTRLEVKSRIQYTIEEGRATPFEYEEEATLTCDEKGVTRFETAARALGQERKNLGVLVGDQFHLTTEFGGKKTTKSITGDIRRTNFGVFCGGYYENTMTGGPLLGDWPLLYPVAGDHRGRQKFREGSLTTTIDGRPVPAILTRVNKQSKRRDLLWNTADELQILLLMEESTDFGTLTYRLLKVNGVGILESEVLP